MPSQARPSGPVRPATERSWAIHQSASAGFSWIRRSSLSRPLSRVGRRRRTALPPSVSYALSPVGSGPGAPMLGSGGCPIAFALDLSPAPVTTFPAPASSNRTSGFPASGFPVAFIPRFMGPNEPGALSAADSEPGTVRTARADHRATAYSTSSSHIPDVRAVASGVAVSSSRPNP